MWLLLAAAFAAPAPFASADLHLAVPEARTADYDGVGVGLGLTGGIHTGPIGLEAAFGLDQFLGSGPSNSNDRGWTIGGGPSLNVGRLGVGLRAGYGFIEGSASDYTVFWSGLATSAQVRVRLVDIGPAALQGVVTQHVLFSRMSDYPPLGQIYPWTTVGLGAAF